MLFSTGEWEPPSSAWRLEVVGEAAPRVVWHIPAWLRRSRNFDVRRLAHRLETVQALVARGLFHDTDAVRVFMVPYASQLSDVVHRGWNGVEGWEMQTPTAVAEHPIARVFADISWLVPADTDREDMRLLFADFVVAIEGIKPVEMLTRGPHDAWPQDRGVWEATATDPVVWLLVWRMQYAQRCVATHQMAHLWQAYMVMHLPLIEAVTTGVVLVAEQWWQYAPECAVPLTPTTLAAYLPLADDVYRTTRKPVQTLQQLIPKMIPDGTVRRAAAATVELLLARDVSAIVDGKGVRNGAMVALMATVMGTYRWCDERPSLPEMLRLCRIPPRMWLRGKQHAKRGPMFMAIRELAVTTGDYLMDKLKSSGRSDWEKRFEEAQKTADAFRKQCKADDFAPASVMLSEAGPFPRPPEDRTSTLCDVLRRIPGSKHEPPDPRCVLAVAQANYQLLDVLRQEPASNRVMAIALQFIGGKRIPRTKLERMLASTGDVTQLRRLYTMARTAESEPPMLVPLPRSTWPAQQNIPDQEWMVCVVCRGTNFKIGGLPAAACKFKDSITKFNEADHAMFATVCVRCDETPVVRLDMRFHYLKLESQRPGVALCSGCQRAWSLTLLYAYVSPRHPFVCVACADEVLGIETNGIKHRHVWQLLAARL